MAISSDKGMKSHTTKLGHRYGRETFHNDVTECLLIVAQSNAKLYTYYIKAKLVSQVSVIW